MMNMMDDMMGMMGGMGSMHQSRYPTSPANDWLKNFFQIFGIPDDVFPDFQFSPWQTISKPRGITPPTNVPMMPQPQMAPTSFPMFEAPPNPMMQMMGGGMPPMPPMPR